MNEVLTPSHRLNASSEIDGRVDIAVSRSTLGWVVVAGTARGVKAIEFGATSEDGIARLPVRFPAANADGSDSATNDWASQVASFIDAPGSCLDLPLDVRGTAFEHRVWQALREIPPGATVSYGEVARRVGDGATAQEVAQACAANVIAVAIPCHRVVRSDGRLGGYRWGYGRKRALLEREANAA